MTAVATPVNTDFEYSKTTVKVGKDNIKAKLPAEGTEGDGFKVTKNGLEFNGKVKQYKSFEAMLAGVGGEQTVVGIVNSVLENRAKGKASSIIRLLPEDGNLTDAIKSAQTALEEYVYSERGVGAKKRLENLDQLKQDIKSGKIKMSDLTDEEAAELIMGL